MTSDDFKGWEQRGIADMIQRAIGEQSQTEAAKALGITPQYLCDILHARRDISVVVAARLHRIGLNGLRVYLDQERRRFLIEWQYETGAAVKHSIVSHEAGKKAKRAKPVNKTAYREAAIKAARSRKRMAAIRAAAAEKAKEQDVGREAA